MDHCSHEGEIPIQITSKYVGDHIIHDPSHHPSSNGLPLPTTTNTDTTDDQDHHHISYNNNNNSSINSNKKKADVKYKECLKNHAASIGGNATDGCGEFMPSGEEGTLEALRCSVCNCHRNFHRKEVEGESSSLDQLYHPHHIHHHHQYFKERRLGGQRGVLISGSTVDPYGYNNNNNTANNSLIPLPSPHNMIMPLGAIHTSESDEMEGGCGMYSRPPMMKKRFRTKFTPEQKEKMLSFAERVGWRLQKQEESVVQQFCQEIGVRRRVLKVWMHNNKHNLAKKGSIQLDQ